jgi:hypothetical protein
MVVVPSAAIDFHAIEQNPVAIAFHRRIERPLRTMDRQFEGLVFDAHRAPVHGMAMHNPLLFHNARATREAESSFKMPLLRPRQGKAVIAIDHFDHALPAFPLFLARGWNGHSQFFRTREERIPHRRIGGEMVEMQFDAHFS